MYFKLFKLHSRGERSADSRRRFHHRLRKGAAEKPPP